MLNLKEIKDKLSSLAESVRGEVLFDLGFKFNFSEFFSLRFEKDIIDQISLCNTIYKYYN